MKPERIEIIVPARLHLGFLDLEGGLGRRFGSLGLALDGPCTRLSASRRPGLSAAGPDAERARAYLARIVAHFCLEPGFHLDIHEAIPAHNGLGSGTQLALATGMAVCRLAGLEVEAREIAGILDRGARSGIGVAAFEQGGVLLDGGLGAGQALPPLLCRLPFPSKWRILLVFDRSSGGLCGAAEGEAFRRLPPFPAETAAHLCRLVVMAALPALAEADLARFGAAVSELQRVTGDYFAPAQGGRFASPAVAEVLAWLEAEGVPGYGQSSWGPTGFALLPSAAEARRLALAAQRRWPEESGLRFLVQRGRNSGASVTSESPAGTALART